MKTHVLCLCAVSALFANVVNAQLLDRVVRAEVPFAFHAGQVSLPAGEYDLKSPLRGVVMVANIDTRRGVLVSGNAAVDINAKGGPGRLIFHKYGDQYFLRKVVTGGPNGMEFTETPLERELQARAPAESKVIVAKR